ncbi:uncharacterized protein LOC114796132 isoform X2 [Denticeps clupeoides]|uniref:uncharacterized protein LOC114796132 isoform X2 n=1 Tax=Denticeps clupeoides TaxID=299321 RepID=UPI0010A49297|nr:uncharacterized protein LOC114796132 isoform X2 [Denticeps clupeoides]
MSQKRRRSSTLFSWQRSLAILAPWRRGKGDMVLENDVVLTKMKLFNNYHEKLLNPEDSISTISLSVSEQEAPEPSKAGEVHSISSATPSAEPRALTESKSDYLCNIFSDSQLPRLYKFESEDSGVELPSGANSPSTPTGSEQSFVVHSRESSCDSGNLSSSIAASDPLLRLGKECQSVKTEELVSDDVPDHCATATENEAERANWNSIEESSDLRKAEDGSLKNSSDDIKSESEHPVENAQDTREANESLPSSHGPEESHEDTTQPLRKSTTSDSLDEYMEQCCRLSEEKQSQANPMGSGLGYLEHICQLIEKIGQLQEHNLKLQRQICSLHKESRTAKTMKDFFLQHCSCGASGAAFQELKRHSRSDYPSMTVSSGTLSDLGTIPEANPVRGGRRDGETAWQPTAPVLRRGLNRQSYTEGEARYLSGSTEVLCAPHRRFGESQTWGRVKDLVKKTKLRNQTRLGLMSSSLKNSCPQLYRPDLGPVDLPRRDRNSMIAIGHRTKMDFWTH